MAKVKKTLTWSKHKFLALAALLIVGLALIAFYIKPGSSTVKSAVPSSTLSALEEKKYWSQEIDRIGAEKAYQEFKDKYATSYFGIQHTAAHIMGALLYEKAGLNGLTVCDSTFAFGCYHSFFGQALSQKGTAIIPELDKACLAKYGPLGTGCQHGIGHGLLEYYGHGQLDQALNSCLVTTQKKPLFGCTSGVFMEYNVPIIIDSANAYTKFRELDRDHPYTPCPNLNSQFQQSCYYEMGQWWDKVYDGDYKKIGLLCQGISNPTYRESCYLGVGNVAAPSSNYDPDSTVAKCTMMPEYDGQITCRSGASWSFYAEPKYRNLSVKVCDNLPDEVRQRCVTKSDLIGEKNAQN